MKETVVPWINMTVREGALTTAQRHEVMAHLTEALMFWEKVPETTEARKIMKGWVYEVAADADYSGGSPDHEKPFYFIEACIRSGRFDVLDKQGVIREERPLEPRSEATSFIVRCPPPRPSTSPPRQPRTRGVQIRHPSVPLRGSTHCRA